jgi:hypothetical protein
VAADLEQERGLTANLVKGGLGELSVSFNDQKIFNSSRLGYPTPGAVIKKVRAAILDSERT